MKEIINPLLVASQDNSGGACRASFRLHKAFRSKGIESNLMVGTKNSDLETVIPTLSKTGQEINKWKERIIRNGANYLTGNHTGEYSFGVLGSRCIPKLNSANANVINLHYVNDEFLSIKEIGKITKPLVWTFHDMWAFCGAEHYCLDNDSARWRTGYTKANRGNELSCIDINKFIWKRKFRIWKRPIHVITPTRWLADCVRQSALMRKWPVTVIPNTLDLNIFKPIPKEIAREILGLPQGTKLILFGADSGTRDQRKGFDLLLKALNKLGSERKDIQGVIFGQSEPRYPIDIGLLLNWVGYLKDETTLALLYNAVDVMVVPSRQDNLPQTGVEAQACGCPVVAFNVGGLPDVVEHGKSGYLAEPFSFEDLAKGIEWTIGDVERQNQLANNTFQRAKLLWAPETVVDQYLQVYMKVISEKNKLRNV